MYVAIPCFHWVVGVLRVRPEFIEHRNRGPCAGGNKEPFREKLVTNRLYRPVLELAPFFGASKTMGLSPAS
jgi:hypothetical protein